MNSWFKKCMLMLLAGLVAFVCGACQLADGSLGQSEKGTPAFPEQALTFVVPYSAGGTTDIVARQLALLLEPKLGQSIHILNQPGASGAIGTRMVWEKPHDGYTYLFSADSLGVQRVMGLSELSYGDFEPIRLLVNDPKVLVVSSDAWQGQTAAAWFAQMQLSSRTPKLAYTGPGGSGHVQALLLEKAMLKSHLVPYPGGREGLLAVMSGQVDFTNANYSSVADYLEGGQLKAVAVASTRRLQKLPDVPTFAELFPELAESLNLPLTPLSLLAPKDVDKEIVQQMRIAVQEVLQSPEWQKFVAENELEKLYEKYAVPDDEKAFYSTWESAVSWLLDAAKVTVHSPEMFGIAKPQ